MNQREFPILILTFFLTTSFYASQFTIDTITYQITSETTVSIVSGCDEDEVYIPSSIHYNASEYQVTEIGVAAFKNCKDLEHLEVADGILSIGEKAFYKCTNLIFVDLPFSLQSIGEEAFYECVIEDLIIPKNVVFIGNNAFGLNKYISRVVFHKEGKLEVIGTKVFSECISLIELNLPKSLQAIDSSAFYSCVKLINFDLPESLIRIGPNAFENCTSLTNLTFPNGFTSIGTAAFSNNENLTSIEFPETLDTIESFAFIDCVSLQTIVNKNPVPQTIDATVFQGIPPENLIITVPSDALSSYISNINWQSFTIHTDTTLGASIQTKVTYDYVPYIDTSTEVLELMLAHDVKLKNIEIYALNGTRITLNNIDISELQPGVYLLVVETELGVFQKQLFRY